MRVYISVDMEGVAGVAHPADAWENGPEYERARLWMTGEANAAVQGAFDAGASEVWVNDSHNTMRNLFAEQIHPEAWLIRGNLKPGSMIQGISEGQFDAALFIGYHARAGTANAVLCHTYTESWGDVRLNGRSVGEVGLNAAFAGHYNVPVALVTGDDKLAAEVADLLPDAERVVVKYSLGFAAARTMVPSKAQKIIRIAAKRAVERAAAGEIHPFKPDLPVRIEWDLIDGVTSDRTALLPGIERTSDRTFAYTAADMASMQSKFIAFMRMGG